MISRKKPSSCMYVPSSGVGPFGIDRTRYGGPKVREPVHAAENRMERIDQPCDEGCLMQRWTCPRGHQGEYAANGARPSSCPVCGVSLLTVSDSGTLLTRIHGGGTGDMQATQPPEA